MYPQKQKSFTLVEMIVVILILGILMTALTYKVTSTIGKARDVARIKDITTLTQGLNLYYTDNQSYPPHNPNPTAGLAGSWFGVVNCGWSGCWWETSLDTGWMSSIVWRYLTSAPKDPRNYYNSQFPWDTLSPRDVYMYVYANYSSWYVRGDLESCDVPNYALIGSTSFEQTTPGMRPACPWYDWSTMVDYGFVLYKGMPYAEYTHYPLQENVGTWGVWTGGTGWGWGGTGWVWGGTGWGWGWGIIGGLAGTRVGNCWGSTASSYSVWQAISCNCDSDDVEPNDDNVRGTNEYTHNSKICCAAAHAGIIPVGWWNISILITPWRKNYIGSYQNGVNSKSKNNSPRSFRVYYYLPN